METKAEEKDEKTREKGRDKAKRRIGANEKGETEKWELPVKGQDQE